ncbi:MAG TPA: hypothetical protein VEH55_07785 [Gaiellaceae bacterium]|nr:hypothetical protein [Gaiellaceae bacterium]
MPAVDIFRTPRLLAGARREAERGRLGSMEGPDQMDMKGGGLAMLRMMNTPAGGHDHHGHEHAQHGHA